ncbi:MAG: PAS domain-containing protein, partial [Bacteroidales bacterium]|nr:PAS domain-containing protein [Bacteroidales bacterium]
IKNYFKISNSVIVIYSILPFLIFSLIAFTLYFQQKNKIFDDADNQMSKNINTLVTSVEIDLLRIEEKNNIALNTFKVFTSTNKTFFTFSDTPIIIKAYNYETNIEQNVTIKNWKFRKDTLYRNASFLHSISLSLKNELIIAQKTTEGYVTVAASKPELELLLLPFSTNLAYTIENGETYKGQININEVDFLISAAPLYVDGKIEGMLMSLQKNEFSLQLSELFGKQIYFKRGYPFAVDKNGILILHPTDPNTSIANSNLFKNILNSQNSPTPVKIEYKWPENNKAEDKIMYVKYIPEVELFVGSTYFVDDFKPQLDKLKFFLILAVLLSTAILSITLIFISNYYSNKNEQVIEILKSFAQGVIPKEYLNLKFSDNLSPDSELILKYKTLQTFTEHLKNENYTYDYVMWSEDDKVGENLIKLNNHLKENQQKALEKSKEQEKLIWLNEGMSKFIEILKYQVIEIKELAYKIISQIVEYINANEGGFFILVEEDGQKYLELLAAYAMHKKKLLNRKIELGVGFIGRVALEKKTLFITEIPDSFTKISTALGQGKPKSIVILPLIFNDDIIGVIELSSFEILSDLQLTFLERISENISANLAMWRASQQTADLLRESREQTIVQQEQQKTLQEHLKELENLREQGFQREIELNSIIKAVDTTALLVEYDRSGRITSANNRFLDTLERTSEEIIGKHHRDITSMDTASPEYKDFWKDLLEGKTKRFIESFTILENAIWLSQNYVPIVDKNDKVFKILNIAIDITENKILERQLRDQVREISKEARTVRKEQRKVRKEREEFLNKENLYKSIIGAAGKYIGHVEFTIDGNITFINKAFANLIGIDFKLLEGKNIKDLIDSNDFEIFKLALEKAKSGAEYSSKISLINAEQEKFKIDYTITPVLNLNEKVDKIILITKIQHNE